MEGHLFARAVTVVTIVAGLGALAVFQSSLTAMFVEGFIGRALRRRRMDKRIRELEHHSIIVGCGRTGRYVVEELAVTGRPLVVVDTDAGRVERLAEDLGMEIIHLIGDATDDHVLERAGIAVADGLVTALPDDRDNLFVTLSSRALNPKLRIVAKVVESDNEPKLRRAGADRTVSPQHIGGLRLASELVRPMVMRFLDEMLHLSEPVRFEEVTIEATSTFVGQSLRQLPIREQTRLLVIALHLPDDSYRYNPSPDERIEAGTKLIVLGEPSGTAKLKQLMAGGASR
jgi:voltage-gated potassium channel